MMAVPHEALPPAATAGVIADFLRNDRGEKRHHPAPPLVATASIDGIAESVCIIRYSSESMFGVLTEPAPETDPSPYLVLLLNAGGVRHIGPNRMWADVARRWAAAGIPSLRLDLCGIGESDGAHNLDIPDLYHEQMIEQVESAMQAIRSRLGFHQFVMVGLCAGAFWGFHAALRSREVRAAILLNPRLLCWDPEADRRRTLQRVARGLLNPEDWMRVVRGGIQREDLRRAVRTVLRGFPSNHSRQVPTKPDTLDQAWRVIRDHRTRLSFLFTEGEPLLGEMEEQGQLPAETDPFVQSIRIGSHAGHTFRPQWAQKLAQEVIDRELAALRSGASELVSGPPIR